jgi:hypothetical protein
MMARTDQAREERYRLCLKEDASRTSLAARHVQCFGASIKMTNLTGGRLPISRTGQKARRQ